MKKWRKAIENAPIWALFLSGIGVLILAIFTVVSGSFMAAGNILISVLLGLVTFVVISIVLFFLIKLKGAKEFQKKRRKQENVWLLGYGLIFILSFLVFSHTYNVLFVQKAEVDKNIKDYLSYLDPVDKSYTTYTFNLKKEFELEMDNALNSPNTNKLVEIKRKYNINRELTHRNKIEYLNRLDEVLHGGTYKTAKSNLNRLKRDLRHIKRIDGYVFNYPQQFNKFQSGVEEVVKKYEDIPKGHIIGRKNPFEYNGGALPGFKNMSNPFNMLGGDIWIYIAFLVLQFLILSAYIFAKRPSSPPPPPPEDLKQYIIINQKGIIVTK